MMNTAHVNRDKLQQRTLSDYPALQHEFLDPKNAPLIDQAGHHLNIIKRECCLNEYRTAWEQRQLVRKDLPEARITGCSIPALLPTPLFENSPGFFVRGEFLVVAYMGNRPNSGYHPNSGELLEAFKKDLPYFKGKHTLFRLTDVLATDFHFLGIREPNAPRGATFLLEREDLLQENFAIINAMKSGGADVVALVPNTSSADEYAQIAKLIKNETGDTPTGLMVETEEASRNLDRFKGCSIYFPGPSDLIAEKLSVTRGEFRGHFGTEGLLREITDDFLTGLKNVKGSTRFYTIKDMNWSISTPPKDSEQIRTLTTPELFLSAEEHAELLKCNSLS